MNLSIPLTPWIVGLAGIFVWGHLNARVVVANEWIGSSSCASATCHGGTVGRGPAWNHSYSLSRSADPHSTSGALLYDTDSRRIVAALSPDAKSDNDYDIVLRQRCISCHLTAKPEDIISTSRLDPQQVGEGVSCESCHGPAGAWLQPHVLESWKGEMRFQPQTGLLDTESLVGRAEGCVRCHVGSRIADGMVRDMNHDLIAAGHPALRFDLLTYCDNMPHHWNDFGEVENKFSESALRIRTVGRSIALMAAARLSAERALDSQSNTSSLSITANVPWPELSDFDCFGCHQSLSPRSYRPPSNVVGKPSLQISDGLPLWNAWYTSSDVSGSDSPLWQFRAKPSGQADWLTAATEISDLLRQKAISETTAPAPDALKRIGEIRANISKRAPNDWNAAARIYLELEAAARDISSKTPTRALGQNLSRSLEITVAPMLRFTGSDGAVDSRTRSPQNFDPLAFRIQTIKALDTLDATQP